MRDHVVQLARDPRTLAVRRRARARIPRRVELLGDIASLLLASGPRAHHATKRVWQQDREQLHRDHGRDPAAGLRQSIERGDHDREREHPHRTALGRERAEPVEQQDHAHLNPSGAVQVAPHAGQHAYGHQRQDDEHRGERPATTNRHPPRQRDHGQTRIAPVVDRVAKPYLQLDLDQQRCGHEPIETDPIQRANAG